MRTEKQQQASRLNGARSRGPVTVQGKRKSSLADSLLLKGEQRQTFLRLLNRLAALHQPANEIEWHFVETMLCARWRILRLWSLDSINFVREVEQKAALGSPEALRAQYLVKSSTGQLLKYEESYDRQYHRALSNLFRAQHLRRLGEQGRESGVRLKTSATLLPEPENWLKTEASAQDRQG